MPLPIRFREQESEDPLQALCPWLNFIRTDIVLQKDGSLLAGFNYEGLDPESADVAKINKATELLEGAYAQLDERITAWWLVDKRMDTSYDLIEPYNPVSAALDREYSKQFTAGKTFKTTYQFFMLYTPATGTDKFLDRVSALRNQGTPLGKAMISALKESLSGRAAFTRDIAALEGHVVKFRRIIAGFRAAASEAVTFKPLEMDAFTNALSVLLNRARPPQLRSKPIQSMLDAWLPTDSVSTGTNVLKFKNNQDITYMGALAMKAWPDKTSPGLFEILAQCPIELTICQIVRFLGPIHTRKEIHAAIEYYKLSQYGLINHAIASASHKTPDASPGKAALLAECEAAMEELEAEKVYYTFHNMTVFVYGRSQKELEANIGVASQQLSAQAFTVVREERNTMPSFAAMLPGHWDQQTRYDALSVPNVANCSPIFTMLPGPDTHPFFSKDIYLRPVPPLTVFGNVYGGRSNFMSHVGQVGHMLIVAPTGAGKTTFVNFSLSQFQRYENCNTFIFDRNYSCKIVTELHGGTHIDLKSLNASFNPFFAMMDGSEDGKQWVREFLIRRIEEGNFELTSQHRKEIDETLDDVERRFKLSGDPIRLQTFCIALPTRELSEELGEWLEGRPYGMFDNEVDSFSLASWTTMEMREIMAVPRLFRAFMDYAFRKIYSSLDGRPTFIYLEEASFLLNNAQFSAMLDDWLKTFRKKNAFVWMTVQSPESVSESSMSSSLLDNVPSMLMCSNEKFESHRKLYKENFGLDDHQIDIIGEIRPKRDYLLIQGRNSRVLQTNFTPKCLAYIRSEENILKLYDSFKNSGDPDWAENYVNAVANR